MGPKIGTIETLLKDSAFKTAESKPTIFNLSTREDGKTLQSLIEKQNIQHVVDDFNEQLRELFQVQNPTLVYTSDFETYFQKFLNLENSKTPFIEQGRWAYFPWNSTISHILPEQEFFAVRTARNRNLINIEEQKIFYDAVIGIGGLSVGNSVALAIVLQGGARHIKLADHDRLALSNTNRVRADVANLGLAKVLVTARQIYLLNPYAHVEVFPDGLNEKNIQTFVNGPPKLDLIIDELDNLAIKYLIREQAKRYKVPVLMGADNGDNAVIDIERYDQDLDLPFFHGRIGETTYEKLAELDKFGIGKTITQHIGPENVTERMQESLLEMGKTIVSWPQLGGAALINGSAIAYCARKILTNEPLENNRALISLDEKFIPHYNSEVEQQRRADVSKSFKKMFGL